MQDLRTEMVMVLESLGIEVEAHHANLGNTHGAVHVAAIRDIHEYDVGLVILPAPAAVDSRDD